MRPILVFFLIAVGTSTSLSSQPVGSVARVKNELNNLFTGLIDAVQRRDTVALAKVYGPRYTFVIGGGDSVVVLSRSERLESVAANPDSIRTLNVERCDFEVYPATAVGSCWIRQQEVAGPAGAWSGIYTTAVFNRNPSGRWQLVASHASVNRPRRRDRADP
ncbi:MAG: YybH family protein [Gemmatimonadales bacterium]